MALNPNWPLLGADFWPNSNGWTDINPRMIEEWSTSRGRQFELDAVQPGQLRTVWHNEDGALDPSNGSGPYSPYLAPYNPIRIRAQWPPTVNRLSGDQATAGETTPYPAGTAGTTVGVYSIATTTSPLQIAASGTAYQGTQVFQIGVSHTTSSGPTLLDLQPTIAPGVTFSWSAYARCMTSGQTPTVHAWIIWYTAAAVQIGSGVNGTGSVLTGGAAPSWSRLTLTATAPANAVYALAGIAVTGTLPADTTFQIDGLQFEANPGATAWAAPGTWYPLYSGLVERFPQSWRYKGGYGIVRPTCVDEFTTFAQTPLPDPLVASVNTPAGGAAPRFAYLLDDPSTANVFSDATGTYGPAQVLSCKGGAGTVTPGTAQTAATTAGKFLGSAQTVTTFGGPTTAGVGTYGLPMSAIALQGTGASGPGAGVQGPGSGSGLGWTRMIAFRCTQTPTLGSALFHSLGGPAASADVLGMFVYADLSFHVWLVDQTHNLDYNRGTADLGNWHLAWYGIDPSGTAFLAGIDGTVTTTAVPGASASFAWGFGLDYVGAALGQTVNDPNSIIFNFVGDLAQVVEWPFLMTPGQVSTIYAAWRSAFSGDSSGQRYARILGWAGYTGPTAIDTGNSLNLGPATVAGQDALTALAAVVETENGNHYVDRSGVVTFRSRSRRYNALVPSYTFGENTGAGELPYEDLSFDYDPTRLGNEAAVTQSSTGAVSYANDAASRAAYSTKLLSRTNQSAVGAECQDAANYLVARNKDPHMRVASLRMHPSANTAQWPAALGMELGTRVRVNRRPPGASPITVDGFIEKIDFKNVRKDVNVNFEVSPADTTFYGLFTSLHSTFHTNMSSGSIGIIINPLLDFNVNPAEANFAHGQQLVLDIGLGTQETVTVDYVVPTGLSYTSATVVLTSTTVFAHNTGALVCEPLPAGVTSPSTWDTAAVFDAAKFAY